MTPIRKGTAASRPHPCETGNWWARIRKSRLTEYDRWLVKVYLPGETDTMRWSTSGVAVSFEQAVLVADQFLRWEREMARQPS